MNRLALIATVSLSLIAADPGYSRNIPGFDYDELFANADFVVIAEPASKTRDTRERTVLTKNISPGVSALGVVTEFKCLLVLKGAKRQHFTLHHYRLVPADRVDRVERVILNGPTFKTYEPQLGGQPFLMFLVRERDGRFAPVAGQIDPLISVQEVHGM
jgi:hypothetical protein